MLFLSTGSHARGRGAARRRREVAAGRRPQQPGNARLAAAREHRRGRRGESRPCRHAMPAADGPETYGREDARAAQLGSLHAVAPHRFARMAMRRRSLLAAVRDRMRHRATAQAQRGRHGDPASRGERARQRPGPARSSLTSGSSSSTAEARYHRDRFDLYRARMISGSSSATSPGRLRELERTAVAAEERLAHARRRPSNAAAIRARRRDGVGSEAALAPRRNSGPRAVPRRRVPVRRGNAPSGERD